MKLNIRLKENLVEVIQWTGNNFDEITNFVGKHGLYVENEKLMINGFTFAQLKDFICLKDGVPEIIHYDDFRLDYEVPYFTIEKDIKDFLKSVGCEEDYEIIIHKLSKNEMIKATFYYSLWQALIKHRYSLSKDISQLDAKSDEIVKRIEKALDDEGFM